MSARQINAERNMFGTNMAFDSMSLTTETSEHVKYIYILCKPPTNILCILMFITYHKQFECLLSFSSK